MRSSAEEIWLRIAVTDGVFVPRQRSRLLVRAAVGHLAGRPEPLVVDLCCGCGAIGLAIAAAVPGVRLHAADIDPVAVGCARSNLAPIGAAVYAGDLFAALVVAGLARGRPLAQSVEFAQVQTSCALARAAELGTKEVVLSDPRFRAALLTL